MCYGRNLLSPWLRPCWDRTLQWRHFGCDGVLNLQPHHCFTRLFRHRSKKASKLRVTGLCAGNSPVTGEFPVQIASNAESVSIWLRHHECTFLTCDLYLRCDLWPNNRCLHISREAKKPFLCDKVSRTQTSAFWILPFYYTLFNSFSFSFSCNPLQWILNVQCSCLAVKLLIISAWLYPGRTVDRSSQVAILLNESTTLRHDIWLFSAFYILS